jgi:hypothetical protein
LDLSKKQSTGTGGAPINFARLRIFSEHHVNGRSRNPDDLNIVVDGTSAPLGVHAAINVHIAPGVSTKAAAAMLRSLAKVVTRQRSLGQFFPAKF